MNCYKNSSDNGVFLWNEVIEVYCVDFMFTCLNLYFMYDRILLENLLRKGRNL